MLDFHIDVFIFDERRLELGCSFVQNILNGFRFFCVLFAS